MGYRSASTSARFPREAQPPVCQTRKTEVSALAKFPGDRCELKTAATEPAIKVTPAGMDCSEVTEEP